MQQNRLDDLAADILANLRSHTETPSEALAVLEMVFYMIVRGQGLKQADEIKLTLADFISNVLILHATNEIQGTG